MVSGRSVRGRKIVKKDEGAEEEIRVAAVVAMMGRGGDENPKSSNCVLGVASGGGKYACDGKEREEILKMESSMRAFGGEEHGEEAPW